MDLITNCFILFHILNIVLSELFFHCFSYDVIFTADAKTILKKFLKFDANLVFSAEDFCWPDKSLAVSTSFSKFCFHM